MIALELKWLQGFFVSLMIFAGAMSLKFLNFDNVSSVAFCPAVHS
jgi:predicted branched-subunit amino acid permease